VIRGSDGEVRFVPLGPAGPVESSINAWRYEASGQSIMTGTPIAEAESAYREAARRLRRLVWDPLSPHLIGAARVFVVPDGLLNVVNFAALPESSGPYAVERGPVIHYLSTERDFEGGRPESVRRSLLVVGGASFDKPAAQKPRPAGTRAGCDDFSRMKFAHLPGTTREIAEIQRLWSGNASASVTTLSGTAATETAVKRALAGRRVVHLATHGFFLGEGCLPARGQVRGVGGLVGATRTPGGEESVNPLLLAGLALAGANRRQVKSLDQDDGILTAEEVASLDLQGTEWAVLSACDTGLGQIKAGEGVFGLRRAFQIAGARTVIMSLWSVEDQATRLWMRALYDGRLNKNLNTADAVREASLAVLRARRARGQSTHPFYWAAFVAAGDWR
jgi:CHAT domain-containing protein